MSIVNAANENGKYFYSAEAAESLLTGLADALDTLATQKVTVGTNAATIERERAASEIYTENLSAAKSRLMDVDIADEVNILARYQVLSKSASSVIAKGNVGPEMALKLVYGVSGQSNTPS